MLRRLWSSLSSALQTPKSQAPRRKRAGRIAPRFEMLEERTTMNNRFVVPIDVPADRISTFHHAYEAFETPGLVSGDVIEIKQGAIPGGIPGGILPNVSSLTIRGEAAVGPKELEPLTFFDGAVIDLDRIGFKLQNLNLTLGGPLVLAGAATLEGNQITMTSTASEGILVTSSGVQILNNEITNAAPTIPLHVVATGSQNVIAGNTLSTSFPVPLVIYDGGGAALDVFRDNILINNGGPAPVPMFIVSSGVNGLNILRNTFRDSDDSGAAIILGDGAQNIKVQSNSFDLRGAVIGAAIQVGSDGGDTLTTSATIAGNGLYLGSGTAIAIGAPASGTFRVKVAANDILAATIGISLASSGVSLANVDLGGGTEGSRGGNNFRFARVAATSTSGAIVALSGSGNVQAQKNLFNNFGAEATVFDDADQAGLPDVVTTGNLTGNQAFVQALFVRFLRREGDVSNPNDAGVFVNMLNNGTNPVTVTNAISRSREAFGLIVDDLYHSIMKRDADASGRATWVNQLTNGATLESVKVGFYASTEYYNRFTGDRAFIVSLYSGVLNRLGSEADYNYWKGRLAAVGREGVASEIVNSAEAKGRIAFYLYPTILKRIASASDINVWANSGLTELAIRTNIAASPEGYSIL